MALEATREQSPDGVARAKRADTSAALKSLTRRPTNLTRPLIQRESTCACGGGCPKCEAEHPALAFMEPRFGYVRQQKGSRRAAQAATPVQAKPLNSADTAGTNLGT